MVIFAMKKKYVLKFIYNLFYKSKALVACVEVINFMSVRECMFILRNYFRAKTRSYLAMGEILVRQEFFNPYVLTRFSDQNNIWSIARYW